MKKIQGFEGRFVLGCTTLGLVIALAACSGGGGTTTPVATPVIPTPVDGALSVTATPQNGAVVKLGTTYQVALSVTSGVYGATTCNTYLSDNQEHRVQSDLERYDGHFDPVPSADSKRKLHICRECNSNGYQWW